MSDPQAVRSTRYSLQVRILGAVFVLMLMMYLATLAVLGLPLRSVRSNISTPAPNVSSAR